MLSPLLAFIAVMVKISSPGPVLFRQLRQGVSGKPFHCLKFRTMVMHFEKGTITQATAQDSRITPIGRLLRKTSMDELPQFINVLLGNMSVVGPRPHALQHNEYYSKQVGRYMQRHMTKPGITGWAQINGYRGETDTLNKMAKRVEFDIYYMNNWSFWLDLKIIFWTAFRGWTGKNAY
jgi:putative colanic acid biosynthesis UDP-glucose lipid carrier transferase